MAQIEALALTAGLIPNKRLILDRLAWAQWVGFAPLM